MYARLCLDLAAGLPAIKEVTHDGSPAQVRRATQRSLRHAACTNAARTCKCVFQPAVSLHEQYNSSVQRPKRRSYAQVHTLQSALLAACWEECVKGSSALKVVAPRQKSTDSGEVRDMVLLPPPSSLLGGRHGSIPLAFASMQEGSAAKNMH